jgi:hypothetical protein
MEPAFVLGVKDLRSQVVREACVTIAWVSTNNFAILFFN